MTLRKSSILITRNQSEARREPARHDGPNLFGFPRSVQTSRSNIFGLRNIGLITNDSPIQRSDECAHQTGHPGSISVTRP